MTDAAPGIGTVPLILCIDVEPAARAPVTPADCDWNGFEELAVRALWLDHGAPMMLGDPKEVVAAYRAWSEA